VTNICDANFLMLKLGVRSCLHFWHLFKQRREDSGKSTCILRAVAERRPAAAPPTRHGPQMQLHLEA